MLPPGAAKLAHFTGYVDFSYGLVMYLGHQENALAHDRYRDYVNAADRYRTLMHSPRTPSKWRERMGSVLLRWGRVLCERDGRVIVEIAVTPAKNRHAPDAA